MADEMLPALRWTEPAGADEPVLVLLDQRRLPTETTELACHGTADLIAAVQSLAVRGAPLLGLAGAYGVALAAARGEDVAAAASRLAEARPTAVNLAYGVASALQAWRRSREEGEPAEAARAALAAARELHRADAAASDAMAGHGLRLLSELLPHRAGRGFRLLTHCNTGALVSGGAGTAFAVVRQAHRAGRLARLWVDETRPLLQGARLTAWEAKRAGLDYAVLPDSAAGSLFAAGEVDAVLIGADRISADGSVANKVGSYPLAVLARHHEVPFIVVAPVSTIDFHTADGARITIEQRDGQEVTRLPSGTPVAPPGSPVYNPAFDVTPGPLVSALVTECGITRPVDRAGLERVGSDVAVPVRTAKP